MRGTPPTSRSLDRPQRPVARRARARAGAALTTALALALAAGGCTTRVLDTRDDTLRRAVVDSVRRELADAQSAPQTLQTTRTGSLEDTGIERRFWDELNRMAGPEAYDTNDPDQLPLGLDLLGQSPRTVVVSLERAVQAAVRNNLEVQFASLAPAIAQTQVVQAEAAFDWVFSASVERSFLDDQLFTAGSNISRSEREVIATRAGLTRNLTSGGAFSIQQDLTYNRVRQNGTTPAGSQTTPINWSFQYDQPLMRGFGADVTLAQVRLARNAERNQIASLESQMLGLVTEVERTYWQLWQAYYDILILQRLLERGEETAERMAAVIFRANPANVANARARVAEREANLLRSQNVLRRTSDRLKVLMNDPSIPVGSELLIVPIDRPIDAPIEYNLGESFFTAIESRPEVAQSILSLDDTAIRLLVAANGRLPDLDLRMQARLNALERQASDSYEQIGRGEFPSWVFGLFFEQAIGNRAAEAEFTRRRLERSQAVISYQNTVQAIVSEVKTALDNVGTNYQLIIKTRIARFAAAEVLRALQVQRETNADITPERLDLELTRQEALANAERQEIASLVDYNVAIAEWAAAQGTALERNRIDFDAPSVAESRHWPYPPTESGESFRRWWNESYYGQQQGEGAAAMPVGDGAAPSLGPNAGPNPDAPPPTPIDPAQPGATPSPTTEPGAAAPATTPEPTMFPITPAGQTPPPSGG
ncbi:MAG: TolC family protein [Phycisphaerales bacterium]